MPLNILILCTGNSARSILGEALVTHVSQGRAQGFSAGSQPAGQVNPIALETLARHGVPMPHPRSKSWAEFAAADAPQMDIVITVCDAAGQETCPLWPGAPVQVHWGIPDPAHVEPLAARRAAFEVAFQTLKRRFEKFFATAGSPYSGTTAGSPYSGTTAGSPFFGVTEGNPISGATAGNPGGTSDVANMSAAERKARLQAIAREEA